MLGIARRCTPDARVAVNATAPGVQAAISRLRIARSRTAQFALWIAASMLKTDNSTYQLLLRLA